MNDDRELLRLAAKAAGLTVRAGTWPQDDMLFAAATDTSGVVTGVEWDPLTSDADALRLAVKLKLDLRFPQDCDYYVDAGNCDGYTVYLIDAGNDRAAATRRAIVKAAAAIGEAMP